MPPLESNWKVPFSRPFTTPDMKEELEALRRVLESGQWTQGPEVEAFEAEAAAYLGCPEGHECVAVSSCTAGLYLLLSDMAHDRGEEITVPNLTFAATANAAIAAGWKVRLGDVDARGLLKDWCGPAISVSFGGLLDASWPIEGEHITLRDQAHSFQRGAYRPYSSWSFYPTKNIAAGEGGLVGVPIHVAKDIRALRNHGRAGTYDACHPGAMNFRMTDFQAALLRVQLRHLDEAFARKAMIEEYYRGELAPDVKLPPVGVTHLFWIRHPRRNDLKAMLEDDGIQASIHYRPLSQMRGRLYGNCICPMAEKIGAETLSLPWWPGMGLSEAMQVVGSVIRACRRLREAGAA